MLLADVMKYIEMRQALGYKLRDTKRDLIKFAKFLEQRSEQYITAENASIWVNQAPSPYARDVRMRRVTQLAKYLKLEDSKHHVPSRKLFSHKYVRPLPYIYSDSDIETIILAAKSVRRQPKVNPIRPEVLSTLIGLIACTGMRINEALGLKYEDVEHGGVLHVRETKFGKSRYIPLHLSAIVELEKFIKIRQQVVTTHDYLFVGINGGKLSSKMAQWAFKKIVVNANIGAERKRSPKIHDLRHTFATRALEKCSTDSKSVAKHFVALSTYLGHVGVKSTYWYLEATPKLMASLSSTAEEFFAQGGKQ